MLGQLASALEQPTALHWPAVSEGVTASALTGCGQVSTEMGEAGADVEKLMGRMDVLQTAIDACNGWEMERQLQRATDALRCPPGAAAVTEWDEVVPRL